MDVISLSEAHCHAVARLHLAYLSTHLGGLPGQHLLEHYYRVLASGIGGCGYVALVGERVEGYVCGIWSPGSVHKALLRRALPALLWWGVWQVLAKPALLKDFVARLNGAQPATGRAGGYELRPIVVSPAVRGGGAAAALVAVLLADARARGYDRVHLMTELDNWPARRFYEKQAFRLTRQAAGYVYYERTLQRTNET